MKRMRKVFAALLSLAMVLSLLPATAMAADGETGSGTSGLVLNKTATLADDGTYTINLEAYATGETTTTTEKSGVPLDIVLVIDQSGSMAYNDSGKSTSTESDRRMYKLQEAVTGFVNNISANGKEYNVDHRIAIAGYASNRSAGQSSKINGIGYNGSGSYWVNTGLYVNGTFKNYAGDSNTSSLTAQDYKNALAYVNDANGNITSSITTAINSFKASGGTYTEYGMTMAQKVFDNNSIEQGSNRKRIVVLFTDGETNSNISTVLTSANTLKGNTYNATIYSVGFGSDVDTEFLSHVSSNYTNATYSTYLWGDPIYGGTKVESKYSMTASNREELNKIFENISQDIQNPTTSVTLNADAVMRDIIADEFTLPENYSVQDNISIKTVAGTISDDGNITWGEETNSFTGVTASVVDNNVNIQGFNYSEKFIAPGHGGEKLVVEIRGIEAKDAAVTGEDINTNAKGSGIYEKSDAENPVAAFGFPTTKIESKSYVLDYAKTTELTDTPVAAIVSLDGDGLHKVGTPAYSLNETYGKVNYANNKLTYTPTTTNWNGYDSFYAFGKSSADSNLWSKINVIPANNVYYEDDFVTNSSNGTVGIKYTGTWTTEGTTAGNTETANGAVQGWESSLADDTGYSDGSAHVANISGATASFTFTGTGVDIYSRTNGTTGTIYVTVKSTKDGTTTTKRAVVDNKAKSGDYYQIPTYTFSGDYGTYDVTVRVTAGAASEGRTTYYLDGIRVYNPIQNQEESDSTVQGAYGTDELNATFTEIRRELTDNSGIAFVDEDANGVPVSKNYLDAEVSQLAPEHEVYLAKDQSIVVGVDSASAYYIGLKAPAGTTSVAFSDADNAATTEIKHSTDLYYKVTPNNGTITIRNTGDNLLSITKLRTTGSGTSGISMLSADQAVSAVTMFKTAPQVSYQSLGVTDEELTEAETPAISESDETITEEPGEVIIENSNASDEEISETSTASSDRWVKDLFSKIRNIFGRR